MIEIPVDSTELQATFLGQEVPVYPEVNQICLVNGETIGGIPAVYPARVIQYDGTTPRQRENCYVTEVNNIFLQQIPGYVNARLIGVYGGNAQGIGALPLYAMNCCPGGGSSSASGKSGGGAVGG